MSKCRVVLVSSSLPNRHEADVVATRGWAEGRRGGDLGVEPHSACPRSGASEGRPDGPFCSQGPSWHAAHGKNKNLKVNDGL